MAISLAIMPETRYKLLSTWSGVPSALYLLPPIASTHRLRHG